MNSRCLSIEHERAFGAGDFQPPFLALGIQVGNRECEPLTALKPNNKESFILIGVVLPFGLGCPQSLMGKSADFFDRGINQLQGIFEQVDTPVVEDPARDTPVGPTTPTLMSSAFL